MLSKCEAQFIFDNICLLLYVRGSAAPKLQSGKVTCNLGIDYIDKTLACAGYCLNAANPCGTSPGFVL
jgi:hypothetical protein